MRLLNTVGSYTKAGTPIAARVIGTLGRTPGALPAGSMIHGEVQAAHGLGLGFRHERAGLQLRFQNCALPDDTPVVCDPVLMSVDNARETVGKYEKISGIMPASHPHSLIAGVWMKPVPDLFRRSTVGLTGAGRMLYSAWAPSSFAAIAIVGARMAIFRMPDGTIQIPAGSDLVVRIEAEGPHPVTVPVESEHDADLRAIAVSLPHQLTTPDRKPAADIINVTFAGTKAELVNAFAGIGWVQAEALSARTFARSYRAFAAMNNYAAAPVSPMLYNGRLPDLVFQESLNTLAKRHHIRLWEQQSEAGTLWVGAATHDVAIALDLGKRGLTHTIDPQIDREQVHLVNDLRAAGCLRAEQFLDRPSAVRSIDDGDRVVTDGKLALIGLQSCPVAPVITESRPPRPNFLIRGTARMVLECRYYVTRGSVYYWGYRGLKPLVAKVHRRWTAEPAITAGSRVPRRGSALIASSR